MQKFSIRYFLARVYHSISRRLFWYSKRNSFRDVDSSQCLPLRVFEHRTPLFRKLHGTDEQLQKNEVVNLLLAIARIDGLLLRPGELFSFWRLVGHLLGERTLDIRYHLRESDHAIRQDFDGRYRRWNKIRRLTFDAHTQECLFEELITANGTVMMYQPLLESSYGTKG